MTELISPVYLLSVIICTVAINMGYLIDEVSQEMRTQQVFIYQLLFAYCTNFMGVSYIPHLFIRVFLLAVFVIGMIRYRTNVGDTTQGFIPAVISIFYALSLELSLYDNMKAKAKLFIEKEVNLKQQEQLALLLNSVPDSVMICTKG